MSAFELSVQVAVLCGSADKHVIAPIGIRPLVVQCRVLGVYCPAQDSTHLLFLLQDISCQISWAVRFNCLQCKSELSCIDSHNDKVSKRLYCVTRFSYEIPIVLKMNVRLTAPLYSLDGKAYPVATRMDERHVSKNIISITTSAVSFMQEEKLSMSLESH
jgi:hypothetical protein